MTYRTEKAFAAIAKQTTMLEVEEAKEIERARIASRSTWEKIYDLRVDDDVKDILWAMAEKLGME